jgi:hypothetical protein
MLTKFRKYFNFCSFRVVMSTAETQPSYSIRGGVPWVLCGTPICTLLSGTVTLAPESEMEME